MKKLLSTLSTAMIASQCMVIKAFAALNLPGDTCISGINCGPADTQGIRATVVSVLKTVLDLITLIAVIYIIIAGIRLIVSGGDEGEKDKAKKTIIYVIVGIIVVLFARVIVGFFASIA